MFWLDHTIFNESITMTFNESNQTFIANINSSVRIFASVTIYIDVTSLDTQYSIM